MWVTCCIPGDTIMHNTSEALNFQILYTEKIEEESKCSTKELISIMVVVVPKAV